MLKCLSLAFLAPAVVLATAVSSPASAGVLASVARSPAVVNVVGQRSYVGRAPIRGVCLLCINRNHNPPWHFNPGGGSDGVSGKPGNSHLAQ